VQFDTATRFFRVYSKPLVSSYALFSIKRMTDPNLGEHRSADQPKRLQGSERRKRSNCLRCMVALRRCARLLTPKRQQIDAKPLCREPSESEPSNRRDKPVSRDDGNRPVSGFKKERWNYERTDFGLADRRERRLNHPEFKTSNY
jgi:hypothetical protein